MKLSDGTKALIIFLTFIAFMAWMFYWFTVREKLFEKRMRKLIHTEILKGNKTSIALRRSVYLRIEDEDLILKALEGNEFAIQSLNLELWMKK